jgi:unsaturated chondroitin disaccharide hydrolase
VAQHLGDDRVAAAAGKLAHTVADRLRRRPPGFSAAGTDLFYAVCLGARCGADAALIDAGLDAVDRYAENFDSGLGIFFQVPGVNRAVIDTGLNLLPFYWASGHRPGAEQIAVRHNRNMLRYGIVRPDGSTYQSIEFNGSTGEPARRWNMQGYSDASTWARGQSWALHNYINAFEASRDPSFLDVARRVSRWYVENLPPDRVPFYDFADPAAPNVPRDSCSAAIAANALLRLARLDPESADWARPAGEAIVDELLAHYLSPGGVLLRSSWGRLPPEKAGAGISRFPLEDVMPYGNYWIVEALYRRLHDDWGLLALSPGT